MKIKCDCGSLIIDSTDQHSNKGHLISDTQWFQFWDAVDEAIENPSLAQKERTSRIMALRHLNIFKTAWECFNCGKIYIDKSPGELMSYTPDTKMYNSALNKKE